MLAEYTRDRSCAADSGEPLCVVAATGCDDVVATVRWAAKHRVPVVPRGAGTGLAGGANATNGAVVLLLQRMDAITDLSVDNGTATVEPGVVTADLARAAARHGLTYAPDPGSAEWSTLGGNLATDAGGFRCMKYGVTRDSVLGLDVVLADGRTLCTGHRTTKGVAGYDLTGLFVGSEGTLGVIVGATLRLRPLPAPPSTVAAWFDDGVAAAHAATALATRPPALTLLELVDEVAIRALVEQAALGPPSSGGSLLLAQLDDRDAATLADTVARRCRDLGGRDVEVAAGAEESERLMGLRRAALSAVEARGDVLIEDFAVPRSRLAEMMAQVRDIASRHGLEVPTVAHAGDGNLHPTFLYDGAGPGVPPAVLSAADEMFRAALALGGTLTGEHGIGVLKRHWLGDEVGQTGLEVHRAVKAALDPLHIMNPGKVV